MADDMSPNMREEMRYALALEPLVQQIADDVKARLPTGTDFGVFVLVPPVAADVTREGRIVAITTDRKRVSFALAQWIISAANPMGADQTRGKSGR